MFAALPTWITTTDPSDRLNLWAPDISYWGGSFHVFYAASKFGVNTSCIGHATSPSLSSPSWTDHGPVICSKSSDDWNAIDPNVVLDDAGDPWLVFGSFWSGIKLIPLSATGARQGTAFYSLATRADTAVEGPFIVAHGGYYYLFESVGSCCAGANSTYRMMVGRAAALTGPYLDEAGTDLAAGGGTQLVAGNGAWIGPGHDAIYQAPSGDWYKRLPRARRVERVRADAADRAAAVDRRLAGVGRAVTVSTSGHATRPSPVARPEQPARVGVGRSVRGDLQRRTRRAEPHS